MTSEFLIVGSGGIADETGKSGIERRGGFGDGSEVWARDGVEYMLREDEDEMGDVGLARFEGAEELGRLEEGDDFGEGVEMAVPLGVIRIRERSGRSREGADRSQEELQFRIRFPERNESVVALDTLWNGLQKARTEPVEHFGASRGGTREKSLFCSWKRANLG